MTKSETLQLRLDPADAQCLRDASTRSGKSLSDFVRRELEPAIVAEKIASIARDFAYITSIQLFGSMVRGQQDESSDIDLAIEADGPYRWMGEQGMGRFVARLEEATGRGVDVVRPRYCSAALAEEIARDGRVVYAR